MSTRREFMLTSASMASALAWLAPGRASAQGVGNIVELNGDVLVNGRRLMPDGLIQTGDRVQSGPGSVVAFTIGRDAFQLRQNTDLTMTRGSSLFFVDGARLLTGGLAAIFGRSDKPRLIIAPTVTAGIRGTGCYVETRPESTYFCTCFGLITLTASSGDKQTVTSSRHVARRILGQAQSGRAIVDAPFENHEDAEMDRLALLVGQRLPWYQR